MADLIADLTVMDVTLDCPGRLAQDALRSIGLRGDKMDQALFRWAANHRRDLTRLYLSSLSPASSPALIDAIADDVMACDSPAQVEQVLQTRSQGPQQDLRGLSAYLFEKLSDPQTRSRGRVMLTTSKKAGRPTGFRQGDRFHAELAFTLIELHGLSVDGAALRAVLSIAGMDPTPANNALVRDPPVEELFARELRQRWVRVKRAMHRIDAAGGPISPAGTLSDKQKAGLAAGCVQLFEQIGALPD